MPHWKAKYNLMVIALLALMMLWTNTYASKPNSLSAFALPKVLPAEAAFTFNITHDETSLRAQWQIAPNCYLYQKSLSIILFQADGEELPLLSRLQLPEAAKINDPFFG